MTAFADGLFIYLFIYLFILFFVVVAGSAEMFLPAAGHGSSTGCEIKSTCQYCFAFRLFIIYGDNVTDDFVLCSLGH